LATEAVELARRSGDKGALGWALQYLGQFQVLPGRLSEARSNLTAGLDLGAEVDDQRMVERAMSSLSRLERTGDLALARRYSERCVALCRASGNLRTLAESLALLAIFEQTSGKYGPAQRLHEESLGYARQLGNLTEVKTQLGNLGICLLLAAEYEKALPHLEECLAIARRQHIYPAYPLVALAELHFAKEKYAEAASLLEQAIIQTQSQGNDDTRILRWVEVCLGNLACVEGKPMTALAHHLAALRLPGELFHLLEGLEAMTVSLILYGDHEQATVLLSAAEQERHRAGLPRPLYLQQRYAHCAESLRTALSADIFSRAWSDGHALSIEQAKERAVEVASSLLVNESSC
jgi:tetratricopeptide (TPR) repeat protein